MLPKAKDRFIPQHFGIHADGTPVILFTIANNRGCVARFLSLGATLVSFEIPDCDGPNVDVVLGFDDLSRYEQKHPYFGGVIGRVANRIARGRFMLNGRAYQLATNDGPNHLHGGVRGFDKVHWHGEFISNGVQFRYRSVDGEEGYPGNLDVSVSYILTDDNALTIEYRAQTDRPTLVNLTQHTYFNLAGHASGDILDQELMIAASRYTPTDATLIPTGEILDVADTAYDFRKLTAIRDRIEELGPQAGFDVNFVLDPSRDLIPHRATLRDPKSGRSMHVYSTEPGLQVYTGQYLDGELTGKGGTRYQKYQGVCLEAQHFPDSVNQPTFPSTVLSADATYRQTTIYHFA